MTPEEQEIQAALYAGLMQACIDLGPTVCTAFQVKISQTVSQEIYQVLLIITILQTWGVGDAYFEAGGNPFLFDTVNEPKLSYFSVVDALLNTTDAMKN